jgi:hypothetical protein
VKIRGEKWMDRESYGGWFGSLVEIPYLLLLSFSHIHLLTGRHFPFLLFFCSFDPDWLATLYLSVIYRRSDRFV